MSDAKKPTSTGQSLTQAHHIRLECLKLVYQHGKDVPTNVDKAAELERYVMEGKKQSKGSKPEGEEKGRQGEPDAPI